MKAREPLAERTQRLGRERAGREKPVEPRVFGELAHLHRVFDRGLDADARRLVIAADRHDRKVELRREAPVEPELLLAEAVPALERAEVEERKLDRLLDLVRVLAGQEHPRDVRLGHAHGLDVVVVRGRPSERRDE